MKTRDAAHPLISAAAHNGGNLCPKKPGATGGRMADAVCVHIKFFKLSGSDFSERDDLIALK